MRRWRAIEDKDVRGVVDLWKRCGLTRPWNDPVSDIALARRSENAVVMVWPIDGRIVASAMVGHDGHRGTLYYVGVDPDHRRRKLGREVIQCAEEWLAARGIQRINILVRDENPEALAFWSKVGFEKSPVTSLQKVLKRTG